MNINLSEIRKRTVSARDYIESLDEPFRQKFLDRKQTYHPNKEMLTNLAKIAKDYFIVAFSAEWCKDCLANIPILALISEKTGLEVRIFGGLKKDPLSSESKWRIPPSPIEVKTFNVDKIPLVIIFNRDGKEIGRIIENPKEPTLEDELLKIILKNLGERL